MIIVSRPLSTRLYSYLLLVNLVVKGSYLNPNFCNVVVVVAMYTVWSVTLTDLLRCPSITAPAGVLYVVTVPEVGEQIEKTKASWARVLSSWLSADK